MNFLSQALEAIRPYKPVLIGSASYGNVFNDIDMLICLPHDYEPCELPMLYPAMMTTENAPPRRLPLFRLPSSHWHPERA